MKWKISRLYLYDDSLAMAHGCAGYGALAFFRRTFWYSSLSLSARSANYNLFRYIVSSKHSWFHCSATARWLRLWLLLLSVLVPFLRERCTYLAMRHAHTHINETHSTQWLLVNAYATPTHTHSHTKIHLHIITLNNINFIACASSKVGI